MTFRTTKRGDKDIVDFYLCGVSKFCVNQAELYHAGLHELLRLLADNPKMARLRDEFDPPVRLHSYRAHIVAYVEDREDILVVRVLHGRQKWE